MSFTSFKQYITLNEYELTTDAIPSHTNEDDIEHDEFKKHDYGTVDNHQITHYKAKNRGDSHFTFVKNKNTGETVGHIEHKPTRGGRLALSNVTKVKSEDGSNFSMRNVVKHLINKGHTVESDKSNTTNGAHKMLMGLAKDNDIKTHIEDGKGKVIPHEGDITSHENQAKYTVKDSDKDFLENNKHKHILVMSKK